MYFFFFKQKTAYEISACLVGSEMCIRDMNLEHLVQLKWLDLSFNNVQKIEGLDKLVNLTDLSLYNNKVETIEGLDNCTKLNVLSMGSNQLISYEAVFTYLKKFKHLQVLNIAGNPFTKEHEFEKHLINNLTQLKYLDYVFIDEGTRLQYKDDDHKAPSADTFGDGQKYNEAEEQEKQIQERIDNLKKAHVFVLNTLADELASNNELVGIKVIPGVEEEVGQLVEKINQVIDELQKAVVGKNEEKLTLLKKFKEVVIIREKQAEDETIGLINEFQKKKKLAFREFELGLDNSYDKVQDLRFEILELEDKLMTIEIELVRNIEKARQEFDVKLNSIVEDIKSTVQEDTGFKRIKQYLKDFGETLQEITKVECDKFAEKAEDEKINLEELYTEMQISLLENKDGVSMQVGQMKDQLAEKAIKKEGEIISQIEKNSKDIKEEFRNREYERNRENVTNIVNLVQALNDEIQKALDSQLNNDEDDND
eukprot:TRINITY_DN634_c0_g1_i1.p1 TRINITY_DN634_c0_g1~~TRINITY_DN634_c0_g1_i1.p1  ORF type:complete len:482 (+),score=126.08 TRINITY_DN634_c0_g1_i1:32-1477(+)